MDKFTRFEKNQQYFLIYCFATDDGKVDKDDIIKGIYKFVDVYESPNSFSYTYRFNKMAGNDKVDTILLDTSDIIYACIAGNNEEV